MSATEVFDPYREWLGIEPAERPADHYRLLGLPPFESNAGKILAAADERMALIRSYQVGPRGSYTQNLLNELSAAKLCLLSPVAKAQYDQMLALRLQRTALPGTVFPTAVPLMALPPAAPPVAPLAIPLAPPKQNRKSEHAVDVDKLPSEEAAPQSGSRLRTVGFMATAVLLIAGVIWGAGKYLTPKMETPDRSDNTAADGDQPPDAEPELPPDPAAKATVVLQEGSGDLNLPPSAAALIGQTRLKIAISENVLTGWASPDDEAIWKFKLLRPGFFKLELTYAAAEGDEAGMELLLDDQVVETFQLKPTGGVDKFETLTHTIVVKSSGSHVLKLHPAAVISEDTLAVKSLRLVPVGGQP
jgi:hypothetical protein